MGNIIYKSATSVTVSNKLTSLIEKLCLNPLSSVKTVIDIRLLVVLLPTRQNATP